MVVYDLPRRAGEEKSLSLSTTAKSFVVEDSEIREIIKVLFKDSGLNYVIEDEVKGKVSFHYIPGERTATLTSLGSDRKAGGKDDIYMTILMPMEDIESRIARTRETLKLVAGNVYGNNPVKIPDKYMVPTGWNKDDWGNDIIYLKYNANSSVVYSPGPDGVDNNLAGDDIFYALVWAPLDKAGKDNGAKKDNGKENKKVTIQ